MRNEISRRLDKGSVEYFSRVYRQTPIKEQIAEDVEIMLYALLPQGEQIKIYKHPKTKEVEEWVCMFGSFFGSGKTREGAICDCLKLMFDRQPYFPLS